ncbi:DUF3572 family protein [Alphaproteobacteria bacterium GH1-50]|uniref:DUF3572 family protein n=1 Tax=Kangsaoukella pontilimi TaxID=2691042 RepID=A0A7C9M7Y3_9RHOB|nr:DUF3572 domain-containing protein [Kangsaoukella pontilimi]MXQ06313.1 DUF3572 family protein [Kangsaoukella pontilimi]
MTPLSRDSAELLAIEALSWLLGQDDLVTVFMGSTGAGADDLKSRAQDPEFLASVLDFLLMDDAWITGFCRDLNYKPEFPMRARAALPGGAAVNWT